ncbi:MAG: serine acetyltransferase [Bacteroides sp.]|nr:serine acetyltransferase [Bacteroides sp.]
MDKIFGCWKVSNWFYRHKMRPIGALGRFIMRVVFSADVPYNLTIGKGTRFPHCALGSLFHPAVVIGENCVILHGVTVGGRSGRHGLPVIGNNVWIGAHAIILGNVKIGDNAIIGAGSVVLHDVEANAVVAGNPARFIKWNNAGKGEILPPPMRL